MIPPYATPLYGLGVSDAIAETIEANQRLAEAVCVTWILCTSRFELAEHATHPCVISRARTARG
jgi:hypothetical protein